MRTWTSKTIGLIIGGLIFILLGLFVSIFSGLIFKMIIEKEFALRPGSKTYDTWKNNKNLPPMYLEFYFFNWTNPNELNIAGKKPNFVQLGPYVFLEKREKINVTFHQSNHTVSYLQRKYWHFDEDRSKGSLDDQIVHLDIVVVSAVHKLRFSMFMQYFSLMVREQNIYIKKTVNELLFTGYSHNLIDLGRRTPIGMDVPPFDRFGWFYKRNGSTDFDGLLNMATGTDDIQNLGVLKSWNSRNTTKFYDSPCNAVGGSTGDFWPPFRNKNDISLFSPDLCRRITFEYVKTVSHFGVEGYKFDIDSKTLGNLNDDSEGTTNSPQQKSPQNEKYCYCDGECSPPGLLNVSACRYGAPAFVSLPHFHKADSSVREKVDGMNPNDKDHSFYITLEPNTAVPLKVAARLQVNILLQSSDDVPILKGIPDIYFPVFWFSMKVDIPENITNDLRLFILVPTGIFGVGIVVIVIGILMMLGVLFIKFKHRYSLKNTNEKSEFSERRMELMCLDAGEDDEDVQNDHRSNPVKK